MTLRIQRAEDGDQVHFNLSGRMKAEHVAEIQRLCELETNDQKLVLDLKEVTLVDRDAVMFLASYEVDGARLTNCPPYIREWIMRERDGK
jgi:anti-anti-sigma regulatory factor